MGEAKKPKTGWYRTGSAFLWAGAQLGVEWFVYPEASGSAIGAAAGGFIAGWIVASLLGTLAKWGLGPKALFPIGALLGVVAASGAVYGLSSVLTWWAAKKVEIDWSRLEAFVTTWRVAPAAALGALTGLYVRARIPAPKKKD
jgi:hypothetical protein